MAKYKRRVNNECVLKMSRDYTGAPNPSQAALARMRRALEANAEIIDNAHVQVQYVRSLKRDVVYLRTRNGCIVNVLQEFESIEKFNEEWEQVS